MFTISKKPWYPKQPHQVMELRTHYLDHSRAEESSEEQESLVCVRGHQKRQRPVCLLPTESPPLLHLPQSIVPSRMNGILSTRLQNVIQPDAQVMTDLHSTRNCPLSLCNTVIRMVLSLQAYNDIRHKHCPLPNKINVDQLHGFNWRSLYNDFPSFSWEKRFLYSILSGGKTRPSGQYNQSNPKLGVGFTCQWSSDKADKRKKQSDNQTVFLIYGLVMFLRRSDCLKRLPLVQLSHICEWYHADCQINWVD
jgi:hypothetical protein